MKLIILMKISNVFKYSLSRHFTVNFNLYNNVKCCQQHWNVSVLGGRMAFLYSGKCTSQARLDGKTAIITGCNTGIGKYNTLDFLRRGCRVIMACRDLTRAEEAVMDIRKVLGDSNSNGTVAVKHLDLASLDSVRSCAQNILKEEERIDILVNNADGTNNFEDLNWTKTEYNSLKAYGQSKLANIHFNTELSRRLKGTGVTTYAVHPGWVRTELGRHLDSLYFPGFRRLIGFLIGGLMKSPEQGAQTQIFCAVDESLATESGKYYVDCRSTTPHSVALNADAAAKLWELSLLMVKHNGNLFNSE